MGNGTSQLVPFYVRHFFCNVLCLIRRLTFLFFASFQALLATELGPETWTPGCPLWHFLDDACVAFSRNLVFISLHRHSFCRYAACLMQEGAESLAKLLVELEPFNSVV